MTFHDGFKTRVNWMLDHKSFVEGSKRMHDRCSCPYLHCLAATTAEIDLSELSGVHRKDVKSSDVSVRERSLSLEPWYIVSVNSERCGGYFTQDGSPQPSPSTDQRKLPSQLVVPTSLSVGQELMCHQETTRDITLLTTGSTSTSAGYFDSSDERIKEISKLLESRMDKERLEGMKRIIALMSRGRDMEGFFAQVVKNVAASNIEIKKLVYIYLLRL